MDCIFCKIANKELDTPLIYEDDLAVAFEDLNPQAPHHKLIIPKKHIATINEIEAEDRELVGHLYTVAAKLAKDLELDGRGYRTVMNCNAEGGQTVFHLHLHLLGGRPMMWPPG